MIACTPPRPGLCFPSAPGKRQHERSTVPVSDGIFMPGIRPDSGCCSKPVSRNAGAGGMRVRKAARHSHVWFSSPPVPGTPPVRS